MANDRELVLPVADTYLRWYRTRILLFVSLPAALGLFTHQLWRSGYPAGRCGLLVVSCALIVLMLAFNAGQVSRPHARRTTPWTELALRVLLLFVVALTGGAHSPLLVLSYVFLAGILVQYGVSHYTLSTFATFAIGCLLMFLAPARWLGPPVPDPMYTVTALIALVTAATMHADYYGMLSRASTASVRDLLQARESVAQLELTRTRRLETVASTLSHELKNPLGAIKALVQVSSRSANDPAELKRLQVIESEVDRMNEIVKEYLSFSRPLEPLERSPQRLAEIADEVVAVMQARAAKVGVTLQRKGDAQASVDPRRLKEALINLVANGIEASPPRASVEVELAQDAGSARIAIRDSGRGMTPEDLARVGTPFFTTRPTGTGLGVSLARAVFTQHGGRLEYSSAPGAGTTALGVLPAGPRA